KVYNFPIFMGTLWSTGPLSQLPALQDFVKGYMRSLANSVIWAKGKSIVETSDQMAKEWQRLMPDAEHFPVTDSDERTGYAEIHLHCPLRGTGNAAACWRLMEFDRAIVESFGAQLIVVESQSTSGKDFCRVAIRKQGEDVSDLAAAYNPRVEN
ncbi:MAG: hypothetical protein KDK38_12320, partial [Leptospiraceae bacterium]|nr:hypothetical protein [Leptospiraceae bacterium]